MSILYMDDMNSMDGPDPEAKPETGRTRTADGDEGASSTATLLDAHQYPQQATESACSGVSMCRNQGA